jgi:Xaa-Pro aminopeptidase
VKKRLGAPYYPSFHFTNTYDAELAVGVLKEKRGATIGIVGMSSLHVPFYEYVTQHLPGSRFIDVTDPIDYLKAIKSPEEIEMIKQTAALQDAAMDCVRQKIRPGLKDLDIHAEADYISTRQLGCTRLQVLIARIIPGNSHRVYGATFHEPVLRKGSRGCASQERTRRVIIWELRGLFLGEPSQEAKDVYAYVLEAQQLTLKMLKPGADPKEIWDANNEFLQKKGSGPEGRLYAHGEGYELVERPAVRYDEPMKIQAGMNIAVHPVGKTKGVWTNVCDNYLVTKQVSPCLHKTPKDIIIV